MRYFLPLLPFVSVLGAVASKGACSRIGRTHPLVGRVDVGRARRRRFLWAAVGPDGPRRRTPDMVALPVRRRPPRLRSWRRICGGRARALAVIVAGGIGHWHGSLQHGVRHADFRSFVATAAACLPTFRLAIRARFSSTMCCCEAHLSTGTRLSRWRSHAGAVPDEALVRAALAGGYRVLMREKWAVEFTGRYDAYSWRDTEGPVDLAEVYLTLRLSSN